MGERRGTRFPSRPRPALAGTGDGRLPGRLAAGVPVTIITIITIVSLASCTPREDARSLHGLRNEGLLHAARGTQDGYLEAAKAFERAIDIRETPGDLLNLARVLCAAGRWEAAEAALKRHLTPLPRDGKPTLAVIYLEGLVLRSTGCPAAGAARFEVVAERAPELTAAWYQLGSARLEAALTRHFGLGAADSADWLEVTWPDGTVRRIEGPAIDRYHDVRSRP